MEALGRLFIVEVNLEELGEDLKQNKITNAEWYSVVESFIESFEQEKEIVQLLSVTQIHVENPEENQFFLKSFFRLTDEGKFEQTSRSRSITRTEYYERLIHQTGESVEAKIRLNFSINKVHYLFDFAKESNSTILQIETSGSSVPHSLETLFEPLKSVKIIEESELNLESLSYQMRLKKEIDRDVATLDHKEKDPV